MAHFYLRSHAAGGFALLTLACSFPEYGLSQILPGTAGAAGTAQGGTPVGGAANGGAANGGAANGGAANGGVAAGGVAACMADCGGAGEACGNREMDGDETDIDCGGSCSPCGADAKCQVALDCAEPLGCISGLCRPLIHLESRTDARSPYPYILKPEIRIGANSDATLELKDFVIRYFVTSHEVAWPLAVLNMTGVISSGEVVSEEMQASVAGQLSADSTDSYVEIGFKPGHVLLTGESLTISAEIHNAAGEQFSQLDDYSFNDSAVFTEFARIAVLLRGAEVWGAAPPDGDLGKPARAINLRGDAVVIDGVSWDDGMAAGVSSPPQGVVDRASALVPLTDSARTAMITDAVDTAGGPVAVALSDGNYAVAVHVWNRESQQVDFSLNVQGKQGMRYRRQSSGTWHRLGPIQATVASGVLTIDSSPGGLLFSGLEIWKR